ncbi:MAG: immunoglobulin-like domain-containing protein [Acholeplasmatales bacterium]
MSIIKKVFKYMLILFLLTPLVACEEKTEEPILPIFSGVNDVTIEVGDSFNPKESVTATWNGVDITSNITITGTVNTDVEGVYDLEYRVESEKGDVATKTRKITVVASNTEEPVLPVFEGINDVTVEQGESFDPREGVTATWKGNDITSDITITGSADTTKVGVYNLEYRVESEEGDVATKTRKVTVTEPIGEEPVLPIFVGIKNSTIKQYEGFNPRAGITATWKGIDITRLITITGSVDTTKAGVYNLEYRVESRNGDVATKTRKVTVTEKTSQRFTENNVSSTSVNNVGHIRANGNVVNDSNASTYQEINVLKQGENVLVASWSKFSNGKYVLSPTLDIAKDFELNNPNYEVIAAINGDYFYAQSGVTYTTGPNILFGNRVVKPDSFYGGSYHSVQFNQSGEKIAVHKTLTFSSNLNLALYDESGALIYYNDQVFFNQITLNANQTSIIFNKSYTYDAGTTYFILNQKNKYEYLTHTYFEANVGNKITTANSTAIVIATKDPALISLLKSNQRIIVQNMTNGIGYNDMVIGIDAPIIENSRVKRFNELSTDTEEQRYRNTARNPRTGFGYDKAGNMVLITVDGRGTSKGVDLREFAYIMDYYGIVEGYSLDGGGSTQAVFRVNGQLQYVNTPSETYRGVGNAILFIREKEAKQLHKFEIKNGKIHLTIFDKTDISEVDILLNGESNKYTNLDNEIILELTNPKSTAIAVKYVKNGVTYHLLNELYGGARKYINIDNKAIFDVNEGYSFEQNIGYNSKIFVFTYDEWKAISNIVDAPSYDKSNLTYKMANLSLAVTDANGKVILLRLYQKWVDEPQSGIQLTADAGGNIVAQTTGAFSRNNMEIGVMNFLPEGGFVYVFATPTPTEDDGFSVAMKFAYEHLLGLKPSLYNTAFLLNGNEFTDWTNPPINPFAEGFRVTVTTEELGSEEPKQLYVKIGDKEHIAELDSYEWNASGGVGGAVTTHALVFSKTFLSGLPGYATIDTADDEGRNYTIQYSILAIIDANGKVVQVRIHPGHKLTWSNTQNKIVAEESLTATTLHHGLLADIPDGGYVVLFQNTNLTGNPIRAWGCQQLTGFQDVGGTGYLNAETGGVVNMTVNPFAEGFKIEMIEKSK